MKIFAQEQLTKTSKYIILNLTDIKTRHASIRGWGVKKSSISAIIVHIAGMLFLLGGFAKIYF